MKSAYLKILEDAAASSRLKPSLPLIVEVWETAVGPNVAQNTRPCAWSGEVLTVEANPAWVTQLKATASLVLGRVNAALPFNVKHIHFTEGWVSPPSARPAAAELPTLSKADRDTAVELPEDLKESAAMISAFVRTRSK